MNESKDTMASLTLIILALRPLLFRRLLSKYLDCLIANFLPYYLNFSLMLARYVNHS